MITKPYQKVSEIESFQPESYDKEVTQYWKEKMFQTLSLTYGNDINPDKLNQLLDHYISKSKEPTIALRNTYKNKFFKIDGNNILKDLKENQAIMGANGAFMVNQNVRVGEATQLHEMYGEKRNYHKRLAIEAEGKNDIPTLIKEDGNQIKVKQKNNSVYGASGKSGWILSSPDSTPMITAQSREIISTALWSLERLVGNNLCFTDMDEFILYVNECVNVPIPQEYITKYNLVTPSFDMLKQRLIHLLQNVPEHQRRDNILPKHLFLLLKNISKDPIMSWNFYYRFNLYGLLSDHPLMMDSVNAIIDNEYEMITPIGEDIAKLENGDVFISALNDMIDIFINLGTVPINTDDRVEKYKTRWRDVVNISDTDSVILSLDEWLDFASEFGSKKFDKKNPDDEKYVFKAVNLMSHTLTEYCNFMLREHARHCYVLQKERKRINLKNEFYFSSITIYPDIKKNYSAWGRLREGTLINKLMNTGSALTGSNVNPLVRKTMEGILVEDVHNTYDINPLSIMARVYNLEKEIRIKVVEERDITFGTYGSYGGRSKSTTPWSDFRLRAAEVWNAIYPDNPVSEFSKMYIFNTFVETPEQLRLIKDEFIRGIVKANVFDNPPGGENFKRYGLRTIGIPDTEDKIPEWLIDIININKIVEGHMTPITNLLPALGIYVNRVNSTRSHISSMIEL